VPCADRFALRETDQALRLRGSGQLRPAEAARIGRDQTGGSCGSSPLRGVRRSKRVFTTRPGPAAARPADLVQRRWVVAATLKADILPLQALDLAAWAARGDLTGLIHHADHGSNYLSLVYTDRIAELGATPSTGSVGDSDDDAMAEAVNGLYKTELIRRCGPWRTVEQVELATMEWIWWWNNQRLHG
jgi:putative transposase